MKMTINIPTEVDVPDELINDTYNAGARDVTNVILAFIDEQMMELEKAKTEQSNFAIYGLKMVRNKILKIMRGEA